MPAPLATGLPQFRPAPHPVTYTTYQQWRCAALLLLWVTALSAWLYVAVRLSTWLARAAAGPAAPALLSLLLVWVAASLWASSQPVDRRAKAAGMRMLPSRAGPGPAPAAEAGAKAAAGRAVRDSAIEEVPGVPAAAAERPAVRGAAEEAPAVERVKEE